MYCRNLVQAANILKNSSDEEKLNLYLHVIKFIKDTINSEVPNVSPALHVLYFCFFQLAGPELQDNCYNFLSTVYTQFNSLKMPKFSLSHPIDEATIRNTYKIKRTFRRKLKTDNLQLKRHKEELTEDLISAVVQNFQDGHTDATAALDAIDTISKHVMTGRNELFLEFCSRATDFSLTCKAAERISEATTDPRSLCLIAVLLLKNLGPSVRGFNQTIPDLSVTCLPESPEVDFGRFEDGLRLAERIGAQALATAEEGEVDACVEVLRWMQTTGFTVVGDAAGFEEEIYRGSFGSEVVVPARNTFNAVREVFNVYVDHIRKW